MENRLYIPKYENMSDNSKNKHEAVLQDWVCKLNFKQQTGLISAIRGFDGEEGESFGYSLKDLTRMVRGVILKNADSSTKFMSLTPLDKNDVVDTLAKWTEYIKDWHWLNHIVMAMHTISLYHYNEYTKLYYLEVCQAYARRVNEVNIRLDKIDKEPVTDTSSIEFIENLNSNFEPGNISIFNNRDLSATYDGSYCSINHIMNNVDDSAVMYILDNYTNFNEILYSWNLLTKEGQVSCINDLHSVEKTDKAIRNVSVYISLVTKSVHLLPGDLLVKFKYSVPSSEFDNYIKTLEKEAMEFIEGEFTYDDSVKVIDVKDMGILATTIGEINTCGPFCTIADIYDNVSRDIIMIILDNYTNFKDIISSWKTEDITAKSSHLVNIPIYNDKIAIIESVDNYVKTYDSCQFLPPRELIVRFKNKLPFNETLSSYLVKIEQSLKK